MANIVELREMSDDKLRELLENAREEMFNLRFQHAAARVSNTARIRFIRREMAQVQSVLHKRALAIEDAAAHPAIAPKLAGKEWTATARYVYEDSGWSVLFEADGSEVATALVNLNAKRPSGRRARAANQERQSVRSFEIR